MATVTPGSSTTDAVVGRPRPTTAVRGGAFLFAAMVVGNATNYGFTIIAGRVLGPADYGVLTALLALVMLVQLPLGALQMALSREVATHRARGDDGYAAALVQRVTRWGGWATLGLTAVFMAAIAPLSQLLQIHELGPVAVTGLTLVPTLATLILMGDLQGLQRYRALAASTALPSVARLLLFAALVVVGTRLYGALVATAVAAIIALLATAWWARDTLRARVSAVDVDVIAFLRYLAPVALGILAITAFTNVDLLMVKGRLSSEDAGIFGAASNLAKLAVLLPWAIVGVLFPRVASRRARGLPADDILGRALAVTLGFCLLLFGAYAVLGGTVVHVAFGSEFDEATSLLPLFAIGMTCFSLANVLVSYELSNGRHGYAVALALCAAIQALLLAVVPASLTHLLWVDAAVGVGALVTYQVQRGGVFSALRLGVVHVHRDAGIGTRTASAARTVAATRARVAEGALVVAGAFGVAVALTWPLTPNLGRGVLNQGDPLGGVAWLWRIAHEGGFGILGQTHVSLLGAPFGYDQGNGINVQWLLPYLPAHLASGLIGEVAAYNLVILFGLALSGAAMYALIVRLGAGRLAAIWAGLVFMGFPWLLERADNHASLTHVWGFPLLILAVVAWRDRPDGRRATLVGLALGALWLTSGYYGLMGLVMVAVLLPVAALAQRAATGWRGRLRALAVVGGTSIGAVLAVFVVSRLGAGAGALGVDRNPAELQVYGARLHEFFVPPGNNPYLGGWTDHWLASRQHGSNPSETALYVGILTLLLAAGWLGAGLARWRSRPAGTRFLLVALPALAVAAVLFALPSPLHVLGAEVPAPARLLNELVPAFRVSSRLVVVLMAALVPMAALGLAAVARGATRALARTPGGLRAGAAGGVAVVVVAVAVSHVELATERAPLVRLDVAPGEYALVKDTPAGILAEYPLVAASEPSGSTTLVWQRVHGRRLLNGAPQGTLGESFRPSLVDPSAPGTASALATLGVTTVVDRRDPSRLLPLGPGYALVGRAADGVAVWRVTAKPGVAVGLDGFGPPEPAQRDRWFQWSTEARPSVLFYAARPGLYRARLLVGSYAVPRRTTFGGSGTGRGVRVTSIAPRTLLLRLPRGLSRLTIATDPGPQPIPDGRSVGITMSNWSLTPAPAGARGPALAARRAR